MTSLIWLGLLGIAFADDPVEYAIVDQVDVIEVNHYFDTNGKPVLNQLVFYDWNSRAGRFEICDYKLLRTPNHLPSATSSGRTPFCVWHDDQNLRIVTGRQTLESWTQFDPENRQRKVLPAEDRRGLHKK